jgi:hypothetical protein
VVAVAPQPNLQRVNPIAEFLRQRIGQDRVLVSHRLLSDGEAWRNGIQKLHSYESVPVVRSTMLLGALAYNREPNQVVDIDGWQTAELSQYRQSLLDLAGVRYAVVEGPSRKLPGWRLVAKGLVPDPGLLPPDGRKRMLEYTIYENDARLPRAFVVGRAAAILPRDSSMRRLATLEPRREVLLAQDVLPVGSREPFHAATIRSYRSDRVVVEADLSAPGYLILTDTYYPGWTALVNGKPAPVLPANYAFRAVPLGPGKHVVTFEFAPPGAQPGMILSLLTVAVVVLFSVGNFRSRGPDRR